MAHSSDSTSVLASSTPSHPASLHQVFFCLAMLAQALFIDSWKNIGEVRRGFALGRLAVQFGVAAMYLLNG